MSGPILNITNERKRFVQNLQDRFNHLYILPLIASADIVNSTRQAFLKRQLDGAAMILNVNPISRIKPVSVYRNRLVVQGVGEHQRNKFLWKLARAIVVAAA